MLISLKNDMQKARLLPDLADAIDAADIEIANITKQKTAAELEKNKLIEEYYKSGKKEDQ